MGMMSPIRVGVVGATGYGGAELVRILDGHPAVELTYLAAKREAVENYAKVFPHLARANQYALHVYDVDACVEACDLVFVAMPSGMSGQVAAELWQRGCRVIDLSGDLRLPATDYRTWYGHEPVADAVQAGAVYGLTEWQRDRLGNATLVANPGCFATATLLGLMPAVEAKIVADGAPIIVDAKSGVSGAGRSPSQSVHHGEIGENFFPYRVGKHQHIPEVEQFLRPANKASVILTTQLLPVIRGIYVTAYLPLKEGVPADEVRDVYEQRYAAEPFVLMTDEGKFPQMKHVRGSNQCHIGLFIDERTSVLQVFSVIDNLQKGAAGQAVQNMNVMFGLEETLGLTGLPVYP